MSKTVFAFGRMNPPTIGHEKLADKVASEAKRRGAMPHIYLSHTQNAKKDPLPYNVKIAIAKKAFGKAVTKSSAKNIIQIMQELEKMGHTEVTLIAGSDRVPEFKTLLNKYNGKEYNFNKIDVVSAGERDPDAEGVAGMSASKLRGIAQAGDYDTFAKGMPSKLKDSDKKKVYDTIRSVMEEWDEPDPSDEELDEILSDLDNDDDFSWEWDDDQLELDLDEARKPLTLAQRTKRRILMRRLAPRIARKRKIAMRRRAGREQLTKRARRAAVLLLKKRVAGNKGKNYKSLSPSEKIGIDRLVQKRLGMVGKIAKRLLPKMVKKETERMRKRSSSVNEEFEILIEKAKVAQDPDVDERPGSQPKKYFAGVRSKSKEARAKHFERGTKMSDDDPAAYKPAPGDAGAKTKPSKHTKKFKQMFGEDINEAFEAEYLEEKQIDALKKKSEKTKIPYGILKKVYDRGMAAWRTGHRPGTTPQQWAFARVNSFATKSKGTWGGADKDLAAKVRSEEVNEIGGAGEEGTDKLVKKYKKDTPSQMDERKSPYQKLRDFDKSRQAVGKKSMFNDKPTEFVRMKKPGAMTTMNVPSNEIDKYVKMGYKAIKENDAVNALKKDHNKEKEALKDKHDREMDTARLRDTRTKNLDEAFEMSMQTQAGMGETMFAKDFMQIRAGYEHHPDVEEALEEDYGWEEETDFVVIDEGAAEYQGRKVDLNNPTKSDNPKKKYMVYVKNDKGNVVKVHFGDPNMSIKRDDPERRKSFRARHGCDVDPGPKWKAKYWSCKFWSTKSVSDLMKG